MEDLMKEMDGRNCFTFLPYDQRILCHYTKIGDDSPASMAEEEFRGFQVIGEVFERMFKDARIITLEEFLGFPRFLPVEKLSPEELTAEIEKIQVMLTGNRIRIAQTKTYPEEEMYSFLTTDLMAQEVYDIRLGDMYCTFVYELIRPDPKSDIANCIEEWMAIFLLMDWRIINFCSTEDLQLDGSPFFANRRDFMQKAKKQFEGWMPAEMNLRFVWEGEHQTEIEVAASFDMRFQDTEIFKPLNDVRFIMIKDGRQWKIKNVTGLLLE
ncbi:MAG: hypothetical protein U0Y08_02495 [Bacteroidia bacterium]